MALAGRASPHPAWHQEVNIRLQIWLIERQLKARSPKTRLKAVQSLRHLDHHSVVGFLTRALSDEDREVRLEAALGLGEESDDRAVTALAGALRDPEEAVQVAAIKSLRRLGGEAALAALAATFFKGSPAVKWRAAQALRALHWQPGTAEEQMHWFIALGEMSRLSVFGVAAVKPLVAVLRTGSETMRLAAVNALEAIADPSVEKPLLEAAQDAAAAVRTAAAHALVNHPGPASGRVLIGALKDSEHNVRVAAASSLGKLGEARAVEPLVLLLKEQNWESRTVALEALGRLGDARALAPVLTCLSDRDPEVRRHAADALGRFGDGSILEKLVFAMVDENNGVREAAFRALNQLCPDWETSDRVRRLIPDITAALKDKSAGAQYAVSHMFRRVAGDNLATSKLVAAPTFGGDREAQTLPAILSSLLRDKDADLRFVAAEAVARLRLAGCANALNVAVGDANEWVRSAASHALAALNNGEPSAHSLPATPRPQLQSLLISSTEGATLHQWECADAEREIRFSEMIARRSRRMAETVSLGDFDRLEIAGERGRSVVLFLPEGIAQAGLESPAASPPSEVSRGATAEFSAEQTKEHIEEWLRQAASTRGVLVRSVRFTDRTVVCDLDSRSFPAVMLEQVFGAVTEVFQSLASQAQPARRLSWTFSRAAAHFTQRDDGTLLGVFTPMKGVPVDFAGLENLFREFRGL